MAASEHHHNYLLEVYLFLIKTEKVAEINLFRGISS